MIEGDPITDGDPRPRLAYDRTLLANERTFASWIRTGVSVSGVGLAVAHLIPGRAEKQGAIFFLGGLLVIAGVGLVAFGAWRFAKVNEDLAGSGSPSAGVEPRVIYALAAAIALLMLALLVVL